MNNPSDSLSKRRQWMAASALVPVVGALSRPTTLQALIYTFFVCVYLTPFVIKAGKKKTAIGTDDTDKTEKTDEKAGSDKHNGSDIAGKTDETAKIDKTEKTSKTEKNDKTGKPDKTGKTDKTGRTIDQTVSPDGASLADSATAQIKLLKQSRRVSTVNFVLALVGSGLISESLAWLSEFFDPTASPSLFHPQFFTALFFALFFYLGLAFAWLVLLKRWQFELKEIFFVCFLAALLKQAILGTLNSICERLVSDPVSALLTLASLLVVGGSVTSLGLLAGGKVGPHERRGPMPKLLTKYCLSLILIALLPELSGLGGVLIAKPLGLYPDKSQIDHHHLL